MYREGEAVPRVSVIIPTYNRAHYLGAAIDSVLGQTSTDTEVIVVDDGSTDQTRAVLEQYGSRVRPLYQEHCGLIAAVRNRGLREARGEYVAFLDSDDLWLPTLLETQVAALEQRPEWGMVYCDGWILDDATGQDLCRTHAATRAESGWIGPALFEQNFIQTSAVVVRRAVLEDVGVFREDVELWAVEDWELWLRTAARYQVGYCGEPLFRLRLHPANTSRRNPGKNHQHSLAVIEHACASAPEVYGPVKQRAMVHLYCRTIEMLRADRRDEEARSLFTEAIKIDPALVLAILRTLKASQGTL